jgi:hypothetical protein
MFYLKLLCNKDSSNAYHSSNTIKKNFKKFLVWFDLQLHQTYVVVNPFHL